MNSYRNQWKSHGEQLISFEPIASPCSSFVSSSFKTLNQSRVCFQQEVYQMENFPPVLCFEFPTKTIQPQIPLCQSSGDKFSGYTAEQEWDGSSSPFTNSLHSVVESFLCSEDNFSSSTESYSELPYWDHMRLFEQFSQEEVKLLGGDAAAAANQRRLLSISSERNQQGKHSSQAHGVTCATSSNSALRTAASGKKRIRWTRDLHEPFVTIVNSLGGPHKAKPKEILEMMDKNLLNISQVKSHLQKYRTTMCVQKALQEKPVERHGTDEVTDLQVKIIMQIEESRQLQLDVGRTLEEQLEMQRNLCQLIEQQKEKLTDHQKRKIETGQKPSLRPASVRPRMIMGPIFFGK